MMLVSKGVLTCSIIKQRRGFLNENLPSIPIHGRISFIRTKMRSVEEIEDITGIDHNRDGRGI